MEATGVVLGGLSLVLWALENYRLALDPAKDYWRYDSTLSTIKINIFVQKEQLYMTLSNVGLQGANIAEVESELRKRHPDKCTTFIEILNRMEKLVEKLLDKLDLDSDGKPRWSGPATARVEWEWRRVKRSLGRTERKAVIDELQYWNNALKNCLERSEVPFDDSDRSIQPVKARFDQRKCDFTRDYAKVIYDALKMGCDCACPSRHLGNLSLNWHSGKERSPEAFSLALSYRTIDNNQRWDTEDSWLKMVVKVENDEPIPPLTESTDTLSPQYESPPPPCTSPSKKLKLARLLGRLNSTGKANLSDSLLSEKTISSSQVTVTSTKALPLISSLCESIRGSVQGQFCTSYLPRPQACLERRQQVACADMKPSFYRSPVGLGHLLSQQMNPDIPPNMTLSRKKRFGIAAAITWAVLHLCDTPWLSERLDQNELQIFFEGNASAGGLSLASAPCVSSSFNSQNRCDGTTTHISPVENFQNSHIRNKTLFALGILLIELCMNKSLADLRRETEMRWDSNSSASVQGVSASSTVADDYLFAEKQTDRVYLEAGDLYGYAVQRCLRCEFPGRDVTKSFEFQQFRTNFFMGVVAPVQATYDMIPNSWSSVQ